MSADVASIDHSSIDRWFEGGIALVAGPTQFWRRDIRWLAVTDFCVKTWLRQRVSSMFPAIQKRGEGNLVTARPVVTLPTLLCGNPSGDGLGKLALDQLNTSISKFTSKADHYLNSVATEDLTTFGPFCGRVILENGCAAILGRFDPFRLMYLSEFQTQPEYALGKRIKSAFSWTGDVIPEESRTLHCGTRITTLPR